MDDARYLVEFLGTRDQIDPEVDGQVFKTKSSDQLAYLTKIVEWSKAARLARVTGGRIVQDKEYTHLRDEPLNLVLALLVVFPRLGKSLFPTSDWRQSLVGDEFEDIGPELLEALLASNGPCPLSELNDIAYGVIADRYTVGRLTQQQRDTQQRIIAHDVVIAMAALHMLGIVVLNRPKDGDPADDTAELSDLGQYAI
jgi:hypothetical protein